MQFLLHTDTVIEAIKVESGLVLSLCREKRMDAWVLSAAVPIIHSQLRQTMEDARARKVLEDFLAHVTLLPLTGTDISAALAGNGLGYMEALSVTAAKGFQLAGVVTLSPNRFRNAGIHTLKPEALVKFIQSGEPSVDKVPLLNIPATLPEILPEVEQGIAEVIRSGHFIMGPKVVELEQRIAEYCQTPFAVGVSSGTDALLIALMAAGIGPGEEVITTPFTFFATAGSIVRTGAKPVFVDIDPITFNMDVQKIEAVITPQTKAIMPVHLYGQCADMDPILELARKHNLTVIEDAAQAIGSEYKNRRAGSMGDYGCFSFFPTKNLGGFGDGGMVTTTSKELYEELKILRNHGAQPKYYHKRIGGNFRIDALQAAVISAKLIHLERWTAKRRDHAGLFNRLLAEKGLQEFLETPREIFPRHIYNQYVVRVKNGKRDDLRKFLAEQNVMTEVYYPLPLHLQECFKPLGYRKGDFPVSEQAADQTLALPVAPEINQQEWVAAKILQFFS